MHDRKNKLSDNLQCTERTLARIKFLLDGCNCYFTIFSGQKVLLNKFFVIPISGFGIGENGRDLWSRDCNH